MKVISCQVADAQVDLTNPVKGFHQNSVGAYGSIRRSVDRSFVEFSKRLEKALDCKARSFQQDVHDAVCVAAKCTRDLFVDGPNAIGKRLGVIAVRVACTVESALLRTSLLSH